MNPSSSTSACRHCRYYVPEGRRGGQCQQLNVLVQGAWTACALAIPPFMPAWESVEDIIVWQKKTLAAMHESTISDPLQATDYTDAAPAPAHAHTCGNPPSVVDRYDTASNRAVSSIEPSPKQATGIKALWM